jgi:SAM-dependent methyltransferase
LAGQDPGSPPHRVCYKALVSAEPTHTQADHTRSTREAYDRLAPVWASTTDDGPFNGWLERPALRALVPRPLGGKVVLDAACGSGAQCEWLRSEGAEVIGIDLSPAMVAETTRRCGPNGRFFVADLAAPLPLEPGSLDGITCSLALHYLRDWDVPLRSFRRLLRPNGWLVLSLDHPFAPPLRSQRSGYFDTELVSDTWRKADVEVTQHFWRRPLSAVTEAFAEGGFVIDRVGEARPSTEALTRYPVELADVAGSPNFIVYRLLPRAASPSA